jgi:hypothetical protein
MQTYILALTTSVFILVHGIVAATAQGPMMPQPNQQQSQRQPEAQEGTGMGQEGMMRSGMMGHGMMRRGMMDAMMGGGMGQPIMMRMIFSLMDSDGDGTISLPEFQAAHERIFKGMDSNKDGRLTLEEIQAFMQGTVTPVRQR